MRLYESTLDTGQRRLIVHLDESKVIAEDDPRLGQLDFPWQPGQPDPDWTVERVFEAYDEDDPPLTGALEIWEPVEGEEPPMREMTREEVEAQQEAEVVALARDAAERLAPTPEAPSPFADGGRRV